ncbi:hypothetical protein FN976_26405 [Caenimonas sedimenti]|uniref:DegT/DnrJ/EryC1/StrS aminotransferase family protein n=1 Tax=Caenimonas sedimenti TaxID=2596921 RepID=A0A562ZFI0_9BURK|nr:hypothetical protein [Caenimonas sedimenti]TWO66649.1 hypothetical protein FN976_26405 [Caenimonas sedimenti]
MASAVPEDAIGGYLPLELGVGGPDHLPAGGRRFQSGRGAFLALLQAVRPAAVWLPHYLCDSMAQPLAQAGLTTRRYGLDPEFLPDAPQRLAPDELLLHVNYFGLLGAVQQRLLERYDPTQLVFDNSQAWFAPTRSVLATIYSPRKFLGLPDGGILIAPQVALPEFERDAGSLARCTHLLKRHAAGAESGYADFGAAEASLDGLPPLAMSALTERLLEAADGRRVRERRRENFALLAQAFDSVNALRWSLTADDVPLCYPLLAARAGVRDALRAQRIYTPCYWPELLDGRPLPAREMALAQRLVALPLDQRYDAATLSRRLLPVLRPLLAP